MNIHEYQGKQVLRKYGVATPRGRVANNGYEAKAIANELGGGVWVVKAQIHAGGRGKAGGVKLAKSLDEVATLTDSMLGMTLVTHQTGPSGKKVGRVYIEEGLDIKKEFYIAVVLDRGLEMPIFIASTEGGMEIEEVAERSPEKIIKVAVDPTIGFRSFHALELALGLGLTKEQQKPFSKFAKALYEVFINEDAEQVEINPMILTGDGSFLALDAKLGFDNNALYRHSDIVAMRDFTEEEPSEIEASESNLSYVKLEGNVGCMVNGAGLAMATMDIIKYEGGQPANFLDVGGGANPTTVAKGFEIILKDKNVKAIFVNIFGGIVQCDRVANGIIEATKLTSVEVPVVVRLDGTNAEKAKEILKGAGIKNLIAAENLKDGAQKVVAAAK
ncbi:ADP-forming succinate--CoA ligase subunit beta [Helicobacter bilis]|uniref:Succinate--CoA ligase [ADP-forming] subunit beta n=3 Tax=Helicobacter bilis TaxID=37372 RepID=A0A4U8UFN0_9HELI|nr:ADP-forming succinate--CoA ligase subunit beta [Helicobacter bilis]MCI7410709.1 ADP-forming succinate--CoA ligase subunit beta [Helicobacter bilis]MDD7297191.1 ADP-forming succinate--CoA ligase subunit beta [Helicobacter bilis]MDY4399663.1 ADP-forming succinate--CoA ligase subunit beta [Helicobacter bilis]TLE08018.1 ADP-forming succinate--CoA ligase subunit beta [Helicobacter bilis]TLE11864.1 ADP-forming succinate--CoA ligase subunit beta [Helicobacter bilis]